MATGQVGERYDGYMGFVVTPPPQLRRQVDAVILRRRNLYLQLAERRNVNPQLVGMVTACQLLSQLPAGEAYMLNDGAWRRRAAAPIALPDYCRCGSDEARYRALSAATSWPVTGSEIS